MNERIKELLDQSFLEVRYSIDQNTFRPYPDPNGPHTQLDFSAEKFAELIIQECLEACSRANEIRHFVPPGQQQVVLDCMREIETTFRS